LIKRQEEDFMKKCILVLLGIMALIAMLTGCGADAGSVADTSQQSAEVLEAGADMPTITNTTEYTLYQNIFYNDQKSDYSGQATVKRGTFATIHDAFNDTTRYYVWGYNDQTKCCDWQWELKIDDTADLPSNGSLVQVSGTYAEDEAALDKLWIVDPQITVEQVFSAREFDIDMQSMSDTLERVQSLNIVRNPEVFEGQTVCCYGRIQNESTLKDPYYDNSWTIGIAGDFELPAFGTMVLVTGTVRDGSLADCTVTANTQY
jgi:hypothetical protein